MREVQVFLLSQINNDFQYVFHRILYGAALLTKGNLKCCYCIPPGCGKELPIVLAKESFSSQNANPYILEQKFF